MSSPRWISRHRSSLHGLLLHDLPLEARLATVVGRFFRMVLLTLPAIGDALLELLLSHRLLLRRPRRSAAGCRWRRTSTDRRLLWRLLTTRALTVGTTRQPQRRDDHE